MDTDRLLRSLIRGAMGRKKHKSSLRYLTGGRNSFLNASTLLAAAGVGWGIYETLKAKTTVPGSLSPAGIPPVAGTPPTGPRTVPPPLPMEGDAPTRESVGGLSPDLLRLIRLTISAARADGELGEAERNDILEYARESGAEGVVESELRNPRPLAEIVAGPIDPQLKQDMYILAFSIVHADEGISGAERIYLAQLAHQLALDEATTARLEREALGRMDLPGPQA